MATHRGKVVTSHFFCNQWRKKWVPIKCWMSFYRCLSLVIGEVTNLGLQPKGEAGWILGSLSMDESYRSPHTGHEIALRNGEDKSWRWMAHAGADYLGGKGNVGLLSSPLAHNFCIYTAKLEPSVQIRDLYFKVKNCPLKSCNCRKKSHSYLGAGKNAS